MYTNEHLVQATISGFIQNRGQIQSGTTKVTELLGELIAAANTAIAHLEANPDALDRHKACPNLLVRGKNLDYAFFRLDDSYMKMQVSHSTYRTYDLHYTLSYGTTLLADSGGNFIIPNATKAELRPPYEIAVLGAAAAYHHFIDNFESYAVQGAI